MAAFKTYLTQRYHIVITPLKSTIQGEWLPIQKSPIPSLFCTSRGHEISKLHFHMHANPRSQTKPKYNFSHTLQPLLCLTFLLSSVSHQAPRPNSEIQTEDNIARRTGRGMFQLGAVTHSGECTVLLKRS